MAWNRREFLTKTQQGAIAAVAAGSLVASSSAEAQAKSNEREPYQGDQRLSLAQLKTWESYQYGMFIHFGMSTYDGNELSEGKAPATLFAPDRLDVDQWVSVARDAGMKYMVLTTKHVAGHCLWPSKHTDYTVANSGTKTDIVEQFVKSCEKRRILPGFYYCSWDNHNLFGSRTPSMNKWTRAMNTFPTPRDEENLPPFTTSLYQSFQTAQIEELIETYGPLMEMWIDIPGVLGRGYRDYLYNHIGQRWPETVIMMNSGISTQEEYDVEYAWPSDLIAIERSLPPGQGHKHWRKIEGKRYYIPGEVCDPIGKNWFYVEGDEARPDRDLAEQLQSCLDRGVNLLLNVPPNKHGLIPEGHVNALMRLRKNVGL